MATKEKGAAKGGAKGGAKTGTKGGAAKGGAGQKGGGKAGKQAGQPRQAVDFTKREHAGAGLPVAAPRLKQHYEQTVRAALAAQFGFTNLHEIPTLSKIVINCGVGEAVKQPKLLDVVVEELALISGQKPVRRKAKKSVANFGLREGQEIGASVTMRRYEVVRRSWQLQARHQGADDLLRDQLRHGRADPRHGHHVRDDGLEGCPRLCAAAPAGHAVPWRRQAGDAQGGAAERGLITDLLRI